MWFQCCQIKHAVPQLWKANIKNFAGNLSNLFIQDNHILKCHRTLNLEKLDSRKLCKILLSLIYDKLHIKFIMRKSLTITISSGK